MIDRLLIVGLGSIGKRHLRVVRDALPQADIRILRHLPCSETPEFANGCFSVLEQACAFLPQAAVIANPAPLHIDSALALASVNCHLLIEKPLSHQTDGVERLLKEVKQRQLVLQVGYNLRHLPSLVKFRESIHSGIIGRVISVRCEIGQYLPSWRPQIDYRQGVSARQALGGGALLELSHELDYLRWIFGEVMWVRAWLGKQSGLEIDVEDTAHLTLGFAARSFVPGPVAALDLDFIRHDTTRQCTAIGESGSLRWNGITGEVSHHQPGSDKWQQLFHHAHQRDESYQTQWNHFMTSILSETTAPVSGEDGLAVLEIIEAARQSASALGAQSPVNGPTGMRQP